MIKVMIAEDQELIRKSLEYMLSSKPEIEIVGAAKNGRETILMAHKFKPDIILMDIRMPEIDGIQCIQAIKNGYPAIKIIILTTFDDDEYVYNALKYGASGYLLKGISINELIESIKIVAGGGSLINPDITTKVVKFFSHMAQTNFFNKINEAEIKNLNKNEIKIIQLIGLGLSNKEITYKLNFCEGTIRNYISSILSKLDLRDRTQIALFAVQSGLTLKIKEETGD